MKKCLFLYSVILFVSAATYAQPFQNTFDLGSDDYANKSVVDINGNIYSVGSSNYMGAGGYDAIVVKSDTAGNFLWHKQYGGASTEFGTSLVKTSDGIVVAGRSNSFANSLDILLVKTDDNGDIQWAKTYGSDANEDYATYVAGTADGGFIVTGLTRSYGNGGQEVFLLKTDAAGDVEWFKTYGSNSDEFGYFVEQVPDGGYVVAGLSRGFGGAGQNDMYLLKTDSLGTLEVNFLIGGAGDDEARRVLFPTSDKLIIAGKTRAMNNPDDIFVGELNTQSFTFNWINTYGGNDNDGLGSIVSVPGEGYVVAGITQSFGSGQEGLVFMIDTLGAVVFSAVLEGDMDEIIQDITVTNNGGIVTGFTNSFGGVANDIYVARISDDPLCYSHDVTLDVTPMTHAIAGPSLGVFSESTASVTATTVTLTQSSTTATVTDICSIPQALAAAAGEDVSSCDGAAVTIGGAPTATGGTPPYTYAWSPSAGLDDDAAANPVATPVSTTTYTVIVTDSLGVMDTSTVVVSVGTSPSVTATATDASCFMNNDGTAAAAATGGSGSYTYQWSNGATTDSISGLTAGNYVVTVTDADGCTALDTAAVAEPTFVRTFVSSTPSTGSDGTATANATGGTPPYTYSWSTTPPQDSSTAVGLAPGTYSVTTTDSNGCTDQRTIDVETGVFAGNIKKEQSINIFPNPARDIINVVLNANEYAQGVMSLVATDGKVVFEWDLHLKEGMNTMSFSANGLTPGFYIIRLKTPGLLSIGKVLIE